MELHHLADELMRTYYNVYLAVGQVMQQFGGLLGTPGARQVVHTDRHVLQATGERAVVLVCQHGCRHEHCHLLAVAGRLERRTHGHLGLAEAYVTAYQTIHGLGLFHVGLHVLRGLQLVGGVLIEERSLQFLLQIAVVAECEALLPAARGIESDEVAGNVLDVLLSALLHAFPLAGAEGREARRLAAVLCLVLRHLIEGMNGYVDGIAALVDNLDHLLKSPLCCPRGGFCCFRGRGSRTVLYWHPDQSSELTDAVVDVYHVVANLELLDLL